METKAEDDWQLMFGEKHFSRGIKGLHRKERVAKGWPYSQSQAR